MVVSPLKDKSHCLKKKPRKASQSSNAFQWAGNTEGKNQPNPTQLLTNKWATLGTGPFNALCTQASSHAMNTIYWANVSNWAPVWRATALFFPCFLFWEIPSKAGIWFAHCQRSRETVNIWNSLVVFFFSLNSFERTEALLWAFLFILEVRFFVFKSSYRSGQTWREWDRGKCCTLDSWENHLEPKFTAGTAPCWFMFWIRGEKRSIQCLWLVKTFDDFSGNQLGQRFPMERQNGPGMAHKEQAWSFKFLLSSVSLTLEEKQLTPPYFASKPLGQQQ